MPTKHWSDCAVHNGPALPAGECDCGGLELADDASHHFVAPLVAGSGCGGFLVKDGESQGFVESQELPADAFVTHTAAAHLPDAHDGVAVFGEPAGVNLDVANVAVVTDFKQTPLGESFASRSGVHVGAPNDHNALTRRGFP